MLPAPARPRLNEHSVAFALQQSIDHQLHGLVIVDVQHVPTCAEPGGRQVLIILERSRLALTADRPACDRVSNWSQLGLASKAHAPYVARCSAALPVIRVVENLSEERSPASLIVEAWRAMYLEERLAGALGKLAAERARRAGDAHGEAFGMFHAAFYQVRTSRPDQAAAPVEEAVARCSELGVQRAIWSCDDLRALLAYYRGRSDIALTIGERNDRLSDELRSPAERFVTLHLLFAASREAGRFDDALRYGYRLLSIAESLGSDSHRACALQNLGALQADAFNLEDARPLQEQSVKIWHALGARDRLGLAIGNLIHTCARLNLHQHAYDALRSWLDQPGGVLSADRHHQSAAIALACLGVNRLEEAEHALALGPFPHPTDTHLECTWTWVRGRMLCARGRHVEAGDLCSAYLDRVRGNGHLDYPYESFQLHDVVRLASQALGDAERGMQAAQQARLACVPLIGSSARARYLSLQLQGHAGASDARSAASDRRRLAAIDQGVREYEEELARQDQAALAEPGPASAESASLARQRRFVAHVSHEMRTPIGGMIGMTSLLLMSNLDDRQRKFVSLTKTSAETLLQLVNDILDLAKIESGRFEICPVTFSFERLMTELRDMFLVLAQAKGLDLTVTVDPALPARLQGDELRIRQVLNNLIGNAIKFTSTGKVSVAVFPRPGGSRVETPAQCCSLRIEVRDTGKGIDPVTLKGLFTEFVQESASTARKHGGSGLGLALARQLMTLMDGAIGVESEPGQGSLFWCELELPVAGVMASTTQPAALD